MTTATSAIASTARSLKAVDLHSRARILRNNFWTVLCVTLSFLTLIPLFSIVFLLLQKGLPLLISVHFHGLAPCSRLDGRRIRQRDPGNRSDGWPGAALFDTARRSFRDLCQ